MQPMKEANMDKQAKRPMTGHVYSIPWGAGYIGCEVLGQEDGELVGVTNWGLDGEPWQDGDRIVLTQAMWGDMEHVGKGKGAQAAASGGAR